MNECLLPPAEAIVAIAATLSPPFVGGHFPMAVTVATGAILIT